MSNKSVTRPVKMMSTKTQLIGARSLAYSIYSAIKFSDTVR
jgi:hypothetical protein